MFVSVMCNPDFKTDSSSKCRFSIYNFSVNRTLLRFSWDHHCAFWVYWNMKTQILYYVLYHLGSRTQLLINSSYSTINCVDFVVFVDVPFMSDSSQVTVPTSCNKWQQYTLRDFLSYFKIQGDVPCLSHLSSHRLSPLTGRMQLL